MRKVERKDDQVYDYIVHCLDWGKRITLKNINAITGGKSPRSAVIIIERLLKEKRIMRVDGSMCTEVFINKRFKMGYCHPCEQSSIFPRLSLIAS